MLLLVLKLCIFEFIVNKSLSRIMNKAIDNMYSDSEGSIYKVSKYSLQEALRLVPIIILIIMFCSLNMLRRSQSPRGLRRKAWVYGRSLAGIVDSNAAMGMNVSYECCVLSGRGLCVGLVTRPEESYRVLCV
jgi:hypothetical protein